MLNSLSAGSASLIVIIAAIGLAPFTCLLLRNNTLCVLLVAADYEWELVGVRGLGQVKEILLPEGEAIKASLVGHVEGENATVAATVEGKANRDVLLLTSCIPDLHIQVHVVDRDLLLLEVSTDCGACAATTSRELVDQSGLSYSHVSEEHDLRQGLLFGVRLDHFAHS